MGPNQPSIRATARCQRFDHILTVSEAALAALTPAGGSTKSSTKTFHRANFYRPPGPPVAGIVTRKSAARDARGKI
jgi:hypothetical protein